MPVIPSLILTNQLPIKTYTASVVVSSSVFQGSVCKVMADGLGNQITFLDVTASYASSASVQTGYEVSSSFASSSMSASYISASSVKGGLTKVQYVTSGSVFCTMSFVNGILISVA